MGSAREARQAKERRRRSLRTSTAAAAAAFVLVAAGASVTALITSAGEDGPGTSAAGSLDDGAPAPQATGMPSYTKDTLPGAIDTIRRRSAVDVITRSGEAGPGGVMADQARRQACERTIPDGGDRVLTAVQRIDYEGQPAYVFVFTPLDGGDPTAYVVTDTCGSSAFAAVVLDTVR